VCRPSINLAIVAAAWIAIATLCQILEANPLDRPPIGSPPRSGLAAVGDTISSGFKKGLDTLSKPFESLTPEPETADPTRLSSKAKPSAELYAAFARDREEKGLLLEAEQQYKKALELSPDHLASMLGYGRLLDRQGRTPEAVKWYDRAAKAHPKDPRPLNHLALCLASHGAVNQAVAAMEQAVRLDPKEPVYRNNVAVILVEAGNNAAAFRHLRAVHDEATAYYNLGYLLQKRGDSDAALKHFDMALRRNPKFQEARAWITHLQKTHPDAGSAGPQLARRSNVPDAARTLPVRQVEPSALHQPPRAAEPVPQPSPQRFTSPWPQPGLGAPQPSDPRAQVPGTASRAPAPAPPRTSVQSGTAPLPPTQPLPAAQSYGTPNANVVYPLPPVESGPNTRGWQR